MRITSSGNVGIGTSSPTQKLDVVISSGPYNARFHNSSTSTSDYNVILVSQGASGSATGYFGTGGSAASNTSFANTFVIGTQSNSAFVFNTNDAERMRITGSGNVGIGTTNPTEKLDISGTGDVKAIVQTTSSGSGANTALGVKTAADGNWLIQTGNAISSGLRFYDVTNSAERMRITSGGNVGIGVSSPNTQLQINGTPSNDWGNLTLFDTRSQAADRGGMISFGGYKSTTSTEALFAQIKGNKENGTSGNEAGYLAFFTNNNTTYAERMRITSGGDVLIGLTSGARLSVRDAGGNDTHFGLGANYDNYITAGSSGVTIFRNATTERMRITSGGELLINTTSDAGDYKLQVNGNTLTSGSITTAAPTGGTAKPWKLGEAGVSVGGANTTAVKVEIDGVVYYLLTAYLPEPAPESAPKPKPEG
jgi:hypothetical protein